MTPNQEDIVKKNNTGSSGRKSQNRQGVINSNGVRRSKKPATPQLVVANSGSLKTPPPITEFNPPTVPRVVEIKIPSTRTSSKVDEFSRPLNERLRDRGILDRIPFATLQELDNTLAKLYLENTEHAIGKNESIKTGSDKPADLTDAYSDAAACADVGIITSQMARNIRDILDARRQIENGTYGICLGEKCEGKPIPIKRLLANPHAQLCVHCQEEEDLYLRGLNLHDTEERAKALSTSA